jgi:hypothetical protein
MMPNSRGRHLILNFESALIVSIFEINRVLAFAHGQTCPLAWPVLRQLLYLVEYGYDSAFKSGLTVLGLGMSLGDTA